ALRKRGQADATGGRHGLRLLRHDAVAGDRRDLRGGGVLVRAPRRRARPGQPGSGLPDDPRRRGERHRSLRPNRPKRPPGDPQVSGPGDCRGADPADQHGGGGDPRRRGDALPPARGAWPRRRPRFRLRRRRGRQGLGAQDQRPGPEHGPVRAHRGAGPPGRPAGDPEFGSLVRRAERSGAVHGFSGPAGAPRGAGGDRSGDERRAWRSGRPGHGGTGRRVDPQGPGTRLPAHRQQRAVTADRRRPRPAVGRDRVL
ncbi:MAG: 2,4-dihydroxyhept-2-ene-1,7-dioic acid aldolase, partial [uncultured Thermomicrobiales bacterium]